MREFLAHVQIRGSIRERTAQPIVQLLKHLRVKRRVRGVLLDVSSGGGASVPSEDLFLAARRLDEVKPVIASIGSIGASGGYLLATAARRIFAYRDSTVGSIGVLLPVIAIQGLLDRIGVKVELLHQGEHKDAFQGIRPITEEERQKLLSLTADSYQSFIETVARQRHRSVEEIRSLATGEVWSGIAAQRLGLVDALGDTEDALTELSRLTGVPVRRTLRVAPTRPFLERVLAGGMSVFGTELATRFQEVAEDAAWSSGLGRLR